MYIILDGRLNCLFKNKRKYIVKTFVSGAYVGEIEILENTHRKYTIKCEIES